MNITLFTTADVPRSGATCDTLRELASEAGIEFTVIDIWSAPDEVVSRRLICAPAAIIEHEGVELARIEGPRSSRQLTRFFLKAVAEPAPATWAPAAA